MGRLRNLAEDIHEFNRASDPQNVSVSYPAERLVVREHRVREVNTEFHQSVAEQYVPKYEKSDTEQLVDTTPVCDVD